MISIYLMRGIKVAAQVVGALAMVLALTAFQLRLAWRSRDHDTVGDDTPDHP